MSLNLRATSSRTKDQAISGDSLYLWRTSGLFLIEAWDYTWSRTLTDLYSAGSHPIYFRWLLCDPT